MSNYRIINIVFSGLLFILFAYSAYYTPEGGHLIPSGCVGDCPSRGLSRSFSAMIRFDFNLAAQLNKTGPGLFLLFFVQFLYRIAASIFNFQSNKLIYGDIIITAILFIFFMKDFIIPM